MKKILTISFWLIPIINLSAQDLFFKDINGDSKADILSITVENEKDIKIKQFYTGEKLWKFTYLNDFDFKGSSNFDSYDVADVNGNGRVNLVKFLNEGNDKHLWFFEILPDEISYIGHTLLENMSGAKEHFANINDDEKYELILVKDEGTNKSIYTYELNGDFILIDSLITSGNPKNEYFADITGDGKEDLILTQNYGEDKRIWTCKSTGSTFEYLAYTNIAGSAWKDVKFVNSNAGKDNKFDLVLIGNSIDGKKLWLFESDGARFNYEITNTLRDGINRTVYFNDIDGDNTDDMIASDGNKEVWSYQNSGNVLTYKLHTPLTFVKTIPENKKFDWENAGYRGGEKLPSNFEHIIEMDEPDDNNNDDNLRAKINEAWALKSATNRPVVIQFKSGTYYFRETISLGYYNNNNTNYGSSIVLRGKGTAFDSSSDSTYTELVFNLDSEASSSTSIQFINISGTNRVS